VDSGLELPVTECSPLSTSSQGDSMCGCGVQRRSNSRPRDRSAAAIQPSVNWLGMPLRRPRLTTWSKQGSTFNLRGPPNAGHRFSRSKAPAGGGGPRVSKQHLHRHGKHAVGEAAVPTAEGGVRGEDHRAAVPQEKVGAYQAHAFHRLGCCPALPS
jgi:hypothetical protein